MGDCKRVAVIEAADEDCCMSKRRRIVSSPEKLLPSPSLPDLGVGERCLWLNFSDNVSSLLHSGNSVDIGAGGDELRCSCVSKDRFVVSCSSSNNRGKFGKDDALKCKDLETKSFETVESTGVNTFTRESTPTSELGGDFSRSSMDSPATNGSTKKQKPTGPHTKKPPPISEIEDFFTEAEKYEQKRFSEKYNFDIMMDVPLEGRYQWIRLKP